MDSTQAALGLVTPPDLLTAEDFLQSSAERVRRARIILAPFIHCTPVLTSRTLNELAGAEVFFKCENFQVGGAFKARGAHHAVLRIPDHLATKGVVTHSSGNHGAAVSLAARNRGMKAHVIMPHDAPRAKIQSVCRYGGTVTHCEPTLAAREAATREIMAETGATLVHPYDDYDIIAGQATAVSELLEQVADVGVLLVPVGGGGLLSGAAIVARASRKDISIYGVEPAATDDAARSLRSGILQPPTNILTVADGLRVALGARNFAIIRSHVDDIVTVSEDEIIEAMRLIWELLKIVVEPSSAVPVAAILTRKVNIAGRRVGVVLTGGNVDLGLLPWQSGYGGGPAAKKRAE